MGPSLGWDPGRRFLASCGPLVDVRRMVGGPSTSGWPLTLTWAARALSAKMAGAQAVLHEGAWPSGFCRWAPGSVVYGEQVVSLVWGPGSSNPFIQDPAV